MLTEMVANFNLGDKYRQPGHFMQVLDIHSKSAHLPCLSLAESASWSFFNPAFVGLCFSLWDGPRWIDDTEDTHLLQDVCTPQ